MLRPVSLALELLDYKVGDYVKGLEPNGGAASMWQLIEYLRDQTNSLGPAERRTLDVLTDRLDEHERAKFKSGTDTIETLILGHEDRQLGHPFDTDPTDVLVLEALEREPVPTAVADPGAERRETDEVRAERDVLQRLAERAWWDDVEHFVHRTAASWRSERERVTPRLIYATVQNLERYRSLEGFEHDVNLRRFTVTVPMPERDDPLVSFNDLESLAEIVRNLIEAILSVGGARGVLSTSEVAPSGAFEYVREAAGRVAQDPYAGRLSVMSGRGPTADQLRLAIRELAKERIPEQQKAAQRNHLEQRLAEALAHERSQRQMFQRDTHRFGEMIHAFFERLADHVPTTFGGKGAGPQLPGSVLFGVNPGLRVERVPAGAEAITARLLGPLRFAIGGIELAVTGTGPNRVIFAGDQERPLAERMTFIVHGARLSIYHEGDYLHVRVRDGNRSLASLMAEALVVFYVLSQPESESMLATLALVSNAIRGEPPNLISAAIERIGAITIATPNRRDAIEGLIRGSARAVGAAIEENVLMGMVQRLHVAITAERNDLAMVLQQLDGAETGVHQLGASPITVDVGGMKLTVREYAGAKERDPNVVLMLPGHVVGSFSKYLLEPMGMGTLVCARADGEVALAYIPGSMVAVPRAM